jgi:uncharacterized protein
MTRRDFVLAAAATVAGAPAAAVGADGQPAFAASGPAAASVPDLVPAGPAMRLRRLSLGSVRPRGWMLAQMQQDLDHGFAGRLDTLSPHVASDLFANRLAAANGQLAWWDAESRGNWLWGYTLLAHLADQPRHRERADVLVRSLRATQDADGYLGIHAEAARYRTGDVENGELWAQSRAVLTLLAHHDLTGDVASLDAARRAVDLTLQQYGPGKSPFGRRSTQDDRTGVTHGLCYADALQALHEVTGDDRYAGAAASLLRDFDAWPLPFPNDDLAAANLDDPMRALHGHAVHTVEHLRAVAFGGQEESRLRSALHKLRLSTTPSGAVTGDENLHGLPHPQAGYEYCSLTELVFGLGRCAQVLADPALGDWLERVTFNAAQGARTADGTALAYLCSDTRLDATAHRPDSYSLMNGKHGRYKLSPTHDDIACCCNPNSTRLLPHYVSSMWLGRTDGTGLVALAYGPSELRADVDGTKVSILQETQYPFDDHVRLTVEAEAPTRLTLWLRRPAWVSAVHLDGIESEQRGGWILIERQWRNRTSFTLHFETAARVEAYPGGEVAVLRGPLQFVQPIPHYSRQLAVQARADWPDTELLADDRALLETLPIIDAARADPGFVLERVATDASDRPWHASPLRLNVHGVTLVPMGCAPLRRADFRARPGRPGEQA